jgi:D-alanyl-D-alanine carboxypeptidase
MTDVKPDALSEDSLGSGAIAVRRSAPKVVLRGIGERGGYAGRTAAVCVAAAALLVTSGCGASTTGPAASSPATATVSDSGGRTLDHATSAKLQQVLDKARMTARSPGVIAGVWSPKGSWIGASGTKGPGESGAPTATDSARVGSVTKTMTATLLLQLVQEHKVSLDATLASVLPDASKGVPNAATATLRQVANMTSGIPSYTFSASWQKAYYGKPTRQWTPTELVDVIRGSKADFAPGKGWAYSNTNYVLLGLVIEHVTGDPIQKVFQDRLFGPLGMAHTSFPIDTNAIPSPHLRGITGQNQPAGKSVDSTGWSPSILFTAGQVISTLDDLKIWADALFTGKGILDPATQQLRRESIIHNIPPNTPTEGYGIGIGDSDGWVGHDGDIPGFNTVVFHNYKLDTTIIVIVNSDAVVTIAGQQEPPTAPIFDALVATLT